VIGHANEGFNMKALITGGTGFVGSCVAESLLDRGDYVTIVDAFPDPDVVQKLSPGVEIIPVSILELDKILAIAERKQVDGIIHLASLRNTDSQKRPVDAFFLNCQGTLNILEIARRYKLNRVVYASSVAVYGNCDYYRRLGIDPFYLDELAPTNPGNFYGATKLFNEQMGIQYKKIYGVDSIGLRLSIIIGPGKKAASQTSELNDVIEKPIKGETVTIKTFNDQVINLIYVKDAAQALVKAFTTQDSASAIYNVGGQNLTTRDVVAEIRNLIPEAEIEIVENREERNAVSGINIDQARKELGYEPRFPLGKAVQDYMKFLK